MHHARVFPGVGWADDGEAGEPPSTTGPPAPEQTSQAFNDSDAPLDGVEDAVKVRRKLPVQQRQPAGTCWQHSDACREPASHCRPTWHASYCSAVAPFAQVVVRVRPPLPREMDGFRPFQNAVLVGPGQPAQVVTLSENLAALSNNGVENGIVSFWEGSRD